MYPARCPSPACRHAFASERSGPVNCPACGSAAVIVLDAAATVAPVPAAAHPRNDRPARIDPPPPAHAGSTLDLPADTAAPSLPTPQLPAAIGRFRVRSKLGAGAFGEVYRAHDPQLDREVALKVAKPGALDSPERVGRFLREARAAANLRHPHIVPVFDSGRDGDRHYIATGFIDGQTLEAEIEEAEGKTPDLARAAAVVRKLAEALGYAHKQGVVHRDVKPANVLVDRAGEPSLTDFGLAVRAGDEAVKTQDGKVMGTPAYMSPEQAAGKSAEATAASDQYALGVMLYEMATGRRPFDGPVEVVIYNHVEVEPRRPRSENRAIPRDLETVILKCLEKDPEKRYPTCEALADDLRHFLAGEPVKARRIGPVERLARWTKRNPALAASLSVAVVALVAGTAVSVWQADEAINKANAADIAAVRQAGEAEKARLARDDAAREAGEATKSKGEADAARRRAEWVAYNSIVAQVNGQVRAGELASAGETLKATAWELRGWEFGHLLRQIEGTGLPIGGYSAYWGPDGSRLAVLTGDGLNVTDADTGRIRLTIRVEQAWGGIRAVAWDPGGTRIVTGDGEGTARVWDAVTGHQITALSGHASGIARISWSPDGTRILTEPDGFAPPKPGGVAGKVERKAKVWDVATGRALVALPGQADGPQAPPAVWHPNDSGRILFTIGNSARVWDAGTGQELLVIPGHDIPVTRTAWSPDGTRVLTSSGNGMIRAWDAGTGGELPCLPGDLAHNLSPGGTHYTTSQDKTVMVWEAATGRQVMTIACPDGVGHVAWSPDGSRVLLCPAAIGGQQEDKFGYGTARVYEAATGREVATLVGKTASHFGEPRWSPDGTRVLFPGAGNRVWDATGIEGALARVEDFPRPVWSPDGTHLLVASGRSAASVVDTTSGRAVAVLRGHTLGVQHLGWNPNASRVATIDRGRSHWDFQGGNEPAKEVVIQAPTARVWDPVTGREVSAFRLAKSHTHSMGWSEDGSRLWVSHDGANRHVYDAATGREIETVTGTNRHLTSPDGKRRVIRGGDGTPRLRDIESGREVAMLRANEPWTGAGAVWSPDGSRVAVASGHYRVWDTTTLREVAQLRGHAAQTVSFAWSPDGSRVLTAGDNHARVWDPELGRDLVTLPVRSHGHLVQWSPDGTRVLAAGTEHNTARVWDGRFENEVAVISNPTPVASAAFTPDSRRVVFLNEAGKEVGGFDLPVITYPQIVPPPVKPNEGVVSPDGRFEVRVTPGGVRVLGRTRLSAGYDPWAEALARRQAHVPGWHLEQARAAERQGNWYAAAFHRERLVRHFPGDPDIRGEAVRAWARAGQPRRAALLAVAEVPAPLLRAATARAASPVFGRVDPETADRVGAALGLVTDGFVVVQALPLSGFESVNKSLVACGYRPVRVRPYATPDGLNVAAIWRRDGVESRVTLGVTREEALAEHQKMQSDGFAPADAAGWLDPAAKPRPAGAFTAALGGAAGSSAADPGLRYVVVWAAEPNSWGSLLQLGVPAESLAGAFDHWRSQGVPRSVHSIQIPGAGLRYTWVWNPGNTPWHVHWDQPALEFLGTRHAGYEPVDVTAAHDGSRLLFATVWHQVTPREVNQPTGFAPADHLGRMRQLAEAGWYPVALAVAPGGALTSAPGVARAAVTGWAAVVTAPSSPPESPSTPVVTSVWHRTPPPAVPAKKLPPPDVPGKSLVDVGIAHWNARELAKAEEAFRECARLEPKNVYVRDWLAFVLLHRNDPAAALPVAEEAVALGPQNPQAWGNLGRARLGTGDLNGAVTAFREALRLEPNNPHTQGNRAAQQRNLELALGLLAERSTKREAAPPPRPVREPAPPPRPVKE